MGSSTDRQYLELHGNQYRVTYGVPADVRKELGSRLKRALGTDSLSKANQLRWSIIQEFKAIIAKTRGIRDGDRNALILEAVEVAVARRDMSEREEDSLNRDVRQRVYEI